MKTKIIKGREMEFNGNTHRWVCMEIECKYCGKKIMRANRCMCARCYAIWRHHINSMTIPGYEEKLKEKHRKYQQDNKERIREYYKNHPQYRFNKFHTGFLCGQCGKVIKGFAGGTPSHIHDCKCPFCHTRFKYSELKKVKYDRVTWEIVEVLG